MNDETYNKLIKRIEQLEKKVKELEESPLDFPYFPPYQEETYPTIYTTYGCIDEFGHTYPDTWNNLNPPCLKCGQVSSLLI